MSLSQKMFAEVIRTKAGSTPITSGTYLKLVTTDSSATGPLLNPCRIIHIQNLTDVPVFIAIVPPGAPVPSANGSADNIILNSQTFILLDVSSDSALPVGEFYLQTGTTLYVRAQSTSTTNGAVWASCFYGKNPL